jgi:hypothetical protein
VQNVFNTISATALRATQTQKISKCKSQNHLVLRSGSSKRQGQFMDTEPMLTFKFSDGQEFHCSACGQDIASAHNSRFIVDRVQDLITAFKTHVYCPACTIKAWALTWLKRHWRLPDRKPPSVGSSLSSLRLTPSSWGVWGARLRWFRLRTVPHLRRRRANTIKPNGAPENRLVNMRSW